MKKTKKWNIYTNGITDMRVYADSPIPEGFYPGRTKGCYGTTTNTFWITNGKINKCLKIGLPIPDGFYKGTSSKTTNGYKIYNNGIEEKWFRPDEVIPEEFKFKGRLFKSPKYKESAAKRKKRFINNGEIELKIGCTDYLPEGFTEGKLPKLSLKDRIKKRDEEFLKNGYVAFKNLTVKQRTAFQYFRDHDPDKIRVIRKDDTYTYILSDDIHILDEYCATNHSFGISATEQQIADWIRSIYKGEVKTSVKSLLKEEDGHYYEIDIYLPEVKIGIEFNGTYWHSLSKLNNKNYHFNKSRLAEKSGIRLIHIYEYEWIDPTKQSIIKSMLKISLLGADTKIYARKCEIRQISNKEAKPFNEINHLQGHRNAQITYGLFYQNELVQLMSFSRTKFNRNLNTSNSWEIIRGCPGSNNIVVGGVSRLLKHFIKKYSPALIFSYCDFNKFDGRSYEACGMSFSGYTGPDMKWVLKNREVVNRNPAKHDELKALAIDQIWGAGSKKYELKLTNYKNSDKIETELKEIN